MSYFEQRLQEVKEQRRVEGIERVQRRRNRIPQIVLRGEESIHSKLTLQEVRQIRALRAVGISLAKIQKVLALPVSTSCISAVCHRKTWKHD